MLIQRDDKGCDRQCRRIVATVGNGGVRVLNRGNPIRLTSCYTTRIDCGGTNLKMHEQRRNWVANFTALSSNGIADRSVLWVSRQERNGSDRNTRS